MSELRQHMVTREWVVVATERAKRPDEWGDDEDTPPEALPEHDPECPFCPGNERVDEEVLRVPESGPWVARVVRNKFPAVAPDAEHARRFDGIYRMVSGVGHHEIVIETPRHDLPPALAPVGTLAGTLRIFQRRGQEIATDSHIQHLIPFRNHGERAGASQRHPHAQLIALPIVPLAIRTRTEEAHRHFDNTGCCVYCDMLSHELREGQRIVAENAAFVAFVPYAAPTPFHLWILPRQHCPSFLQASDEEIKQLADLLHLLLRKLHVGLHNPPYNYVLRTAPLRDPGDDYLHWYLSIIPRVIREAGFELGSGMHINTSLPEESAAFLRDVKL